jgi:photosystem II stability/assembly factor-like uncharacterized protein
MSRWKALPRIEATAPVLVLTADANTLWAGGTGGAARYDDRWHSLLSGLALRSVTALAFINGWLYAGGTGGIARSGNRGDQWQQSDSAGSDSPITAFASAPNDPNLLLAATLTQGVLRSTDAGAHWSVATFGLETMECTTLLWADETRIFVGTTSGVYVSPNEGRAWRPCSGTEGAPIAALVGLADGTLLAGVELGGVLRSENGGETWQRHGNLPPDIMITTMLATRFGVLLASGEHGLLLSGDDGEHWDCVAEAIVLSLASDETKMYAGTTESILSSEDGRTWRENLPPPPLSDHTRLTSIEGKPLVYGTQAVPVVYDAQEGWIELVNTPAPLYALAQATEGVLLASSIDGLFRSEDGGARWNAVIPGAAGRATQMSLLPDGKGYAAGGNYLLRTTDHGATWDALTAPFGVLRLVALQALAEPAGTLVGISYDPRLHVAQIWLSGDAGEHWSRGAQMSTSFEQVSTLAEPPLFTLGGFVFLRNASGNWEQQRVGDGSGIRRLISNKRALFALTTSGIYGSEDGGMTWQMLDSEIAVEQIVDIALADGILYALAAGGQVFLAPLEN